MPTPLLNPQLDNPSQVSLLGTTLMNLLKKNISEPFQLTLLNVGVTNFAGNKGASAGGSFALCFSHFFFTCLVLLLCPCFINSIFVFSAFLSHVSLAHVALAAVVLFHIANLRCLLTRAPSLILVISVLPRNTDPIHLSFSIATAGWGPVTCTIILCQPWQVCLSIADFGHACASCHHHPSRQAIAALRAVCQLETDALHSWSAN